MPSPLPFSKDRTDGYVSALACESTSQRVQESLYAVEHARRMRGGSQAQLMRCSDHNYYVVKFQNNPQSIRILANEMLGTQLARLLGLPVAEPAIVEVKKNLIDLTSELVIEHRNGREHCKPGPSFGSRYPCVSDRAGRTSLAETYDLLPDVYWPTVENPADFLGMLVFDKWSCNTDGRQVVYVRGQSGSSFRAVMIDQGFCFNAADWNFPDAPRRALYFRRALYEGVHGLADFEPWLAKLESEINEKVLMGIANGIPREWYESDSGSLQQLLERLDLRRGKVRELLWSSWKVSREIFPNWNCRVVVGDSALAWSD